MGEKKDSATLPTIDKLRSPDVSYLGLRDAYHIA